MSAIQSILVSNTQILGSYKDLYTPAVHAKVKATRRLVETTVISYHLSFLSPTTIRDSIRFKDNYLNAHEFTIIATSVGEFRSCLRVQALFHNTLQVLFTFNGNASYKHTRNINMSDAYNVNNKPVHYLVLLEKSCLHSSSRST
jgi:hypothetical protein